MNTVSQDNVRLYARLAGFLYLIIIVSGISGEVLVRGTLVDENGFTTVANILASPGLFKAGFVLDSIMLLADVAIAIVFYIIFRQVNRTLSLMAAAFRLVQAAVISVSLLSYFASYALINSIAAPSHINDESTKMIMFLLDMHSFGYDLGLIFFSISTLILSFLIIRSNLFPTFIGYGLMASAVIYFVGSYIHFLIPSWTEFVEPAYIVPFIAELTFCLWLLIKGCNTPDNKTISAKN
uniref:DUF4386 domain-containing protein n=1 Tax=Hydrogenovibrio crunogenus (strain DSM 25203 / XCL-2) TaxID=317025 RepID=Q31FX5_HYDCU